ncbi:MAG TPA: hypothetical protein PLB01_00375 [Thermoanaerobaculia bacterium]|nr:hypothetical protein [Thermoanaerobaculia bacterium]
MSVRFDTIADYLDNQDSPALPAALAPVSFSMWFYVTSMPAGVNALVFNFFADNLDAACDIYVRESDKMVQANNGVGGGAVGHDIATIALGTWHCAQISKSSSQFNVYLDGAKFGFTETARTVNPPRNAHIGGYGGGSRLNVGYVTYARTWTVALTDDELAAERCSAVPVRTSGLYGAYPLATNANDASGNANHWTSHGSPVYSAFEPTLPNLAPIPGRVRRAQFVYG